MFSRDPISAAIPKINKPDGVAVNRHIYKKKPRTLKCYFNVGFRLDSSAYVRALSPHSIFYTSAIFPCADGGTPERCCFMLCIVGVAMRMG